MKPRPENLTPPPKVTMNEHVRLPSTWRDGIGKKLTDAAIKRYEKQGRYGEEFRLARRAKMQKQQRKEKPELEDFI